MAKKPQSKRADQQEIVLDQADQPSASNDAATREAAELKKEADLKAAEEKAKAEAVQAFRKVEAAALTFLDNAYSPIVYPLDAKSKQRQETRQKARSDLKKSLRTFLDSAKTYVDSTITGKGFFARLDRFFATPHTLSTAKGFAVQQILRNAPLDLDLPNTAAGLQAAGLVALKLSIKLFSLRLAYQRAKGEKATNLKTKIESFVSYLDNNVLAFVKANPVLDFTIRQTESVLNPKPKSVKQPKASKSGKGSTADVSSSQAQMLNDGALGVPGTGSDARVESTDLQRDDQQHHDTNGSNNTPPAPVASADDAPRGLSNL